METNLPTPTTARVYVNLPEGTLLLDKLIWVWVNTYRYIFSGLFTSINPSYFDVHQGYQGFDPYPYTMAR